MSPYVTIIINTVNELPERLTRAIDSYKKQENVKLQIIVSTIADDPAIALAAQMEVECVVNPVKGIYEQLNNAVNSIEGDWWSYASGNDVAQANKSIEEVNCCIKNKKLICTSDYTRINPDTNHAQLIKSREYDYQAHFERNFVSDCAMQHNSLIKKYAPFRNNLWQNDSFYDYWLRIYEGEGDVFCYNPNSTWNYCEFDNSKHLLRKNNQQEMDLYREIREKMLASHLKGI
jgi:hypothetical protein